jgi:hypothetical protein
MMNIMVGNLMLGITIMPRYDATEELATRMKITTATHPAINRPLVVRFKPDGGVVDDV